MTVYVDYKRLKGIATECTLTVTAWNPYLYEISTYNKMRVHIVTEDKNDLSKCHELFINVKNWFYFGENIVFFETI